MSPVLAAVAGLTCYVIGLRGVSLVRSGPRADGFEAAADVPHARHAPNLLDRVLDTLGTRLSGPMLEILGEQRHERIERRLAHAGSPSGMSAEAFAGRKAAWTVLAAVPAVLLALMQQYVVALMMLLAGWFLMDVGIRTRAAVRQSAIAKDLPDFLDIVAVTITAGASFQGALRRVARELEGPLADEVLTTLRQMDIGASRRAAFEGLRKRTDVEALDSFISALLQAEELGAPLSDTVRSLASEMRTERGQTMRRKAAETAPKISLVVIMFIVPATLLMAVTGIFIGADFSLSHLSP